MGLKVRRQRTRMALRHEKRLLQKSEINLGREGVSQAVNFPEVRNEIVALKKLEQEQREVAARIAQLEEAIKKIQADRQQNTREQHDAITRLEQDKKPLLQLRNQAKGTAEMCDRELTAVERRIQQNDEADRELVRQLAALETQTPRPDDFETQAGAFSSRRARLPDERAELLRARMGSAEACRMAKEKLTAADAELAVAEKTIGKVRSEFEARDKVLAENEKTQQDALREARSQHQTVEERKNPAYLNIGRHLASQGIAPPNAPHLLNDVHKHRAAVDRHLQHTSELALLSAQIDKQELRKFYFSIVSLLLLLAIVLPLVLQSPAKREWLPQETEAILSLNIDQIERSDLPKRWRSDQPEVWASIWAGLVGPAAHTPMLDISRDATRITRAVTTELGQVREFVLVQMNGDLTPVLRAVGNDKAFERRTIGGLAVWRRPDLAVARVGPNTLAVGAINEVDELVRVRLGIELDLKISGQLFDRFEALDKESALRLISRDPANLSRIVRPIFTSEFLETSQLLGFALTLDNPVKARVLLRMSSAEKATQLARDIGAEPQRWLRLQDSNEMLFAQPPEVDRRGTNLELRFTVPENSARLLLQRIAKVDVASVVAGN